MDALYQIAGYALAVLITWGAREVHRVLQRSFFWRGVARRAALYLADPEVPIDNARDAARAALVDAQSEQVERIARSIAPTKLSDRLPAASGNRTEGPKSGQ